MAGKFLGCISDAIAQGLDRETAAEAREAYEDAFATAASVLGPAEADRQAGQVVLDALERKAIEAKRLRALAVRSRRTLMEGAAAYKSARGYEGVTPLGGGGARPPKDGWVQGGEPPKSGPYKAGGVSADFLKEIVDGNGGLTGSAIPSVKGRYQAIMGSFEAKLADLIEAAESATGLPIRGRAVLDNVVREAFGEETGDAAAKVLAKAWGETAEHARKVYNAAGGSIGKLERWGLPQSHDHLAMRAVGRDAWVETVTPALDPARMLDHVTGQPMRPKRLRAVLGEVYDTILTMGAVDRQPGEGLGKGMLAHRRAEARFLVFKDADSWLGYQKAFGRSDPYSAMMRHLDGMAKDSARMQVLGPNPDHQFDWMARFAERETRVEQLGGAAKEGVLNTSGRIKSAREMYRQLVGDIAGPFGSENVAADVGSATRAALSAMQLGSAVVNDVTSNPVFAAQTRAFAGLMGRRDFRAWFDYLRSNETRASSRRTGLIFERTADRHQAAIQRVLRSQTVGGKIVNGANALARLMPSWINQASFLEVNRGAQRWAFQAEFMGAIADRAEKNLVDMGKGSEAERNFAKILKARGVTLADWDKIRATPANSDGFVTPLAVGEAHGDELGWRLAEAIERETRNAVPEPALWAQAQLIHGTDPGTVVGEITRSAAQYRSFTVTQTYFWSQEFALRGFQAGQAAGKAGMPWQLQVAMMAAPMLIATTLGGAAAVWLKDIAKGNDPRSLWDHDDPEEARKRAMRFAGMAMTQGGGQGILGDFLSSVEARNGKGAAATAFGPQLGFLSDTWNLTVGNASEALSGEDTKAGKETARYLARYSPLSSLWWTRAAWDRAVTDQLQKLVDPDAEKDFRRTARRLERELGQQQWWPEGQALPERAPALQAAVGLEP